MDLAGKYLLVWLSPEAIHTRATTSAGKKPARAKDRRGASTRPDIA